MKSLRQHLALRNTRFRCVDTEGLHSVVVDIKSSVGPPATEADLEDLRLYAGAEYRHLAPLYEQYNGLELHRRKDIAGLVVPAVADLPELGRDFKSGILVDDEYQYEFQRRGVAFATVDRSGNFFVICDGIVYYADHDGGDDAIWGADINAFFDRVTADAARFLRDVGCYTRYSDGTTTMQYIPEELLHE